MRTIVTGTSFREFLPDRLETLVQHVFVARMTGGLKLRLRLCQRQLERAAALGASAFLFCQRRAWTAGAIAQRFFLLLLD